MKNAVLNTLKRLHYLLAFSMPQPGPYLARWLDRHVLMPLERKA
jgi:hypothetical protein